MAINSKTRLLHLLKYLHEQTDENHITYTHDIEAHLSGTAFSRFFSPAYLPYHSLSPEMAEDRLKSTYQAKHGR